MDCTWCCYFLVSETGNTYIGATVDVDRRLRQHNRELQGGAKATGRSCNWKRVCHVSGFPDKRSALQFEWKWKYISRKIGGATPRERRWNALLKLCNDEKSCLTAAPFSEYAAPLLIHIDESEFGTSVAPKYAVFV